MGDTTYCPRCTALVIAEEDETLQLAHCPVCFYAFCTRCLRGWHQGQNCQADEDILEEAQKKNVNQMNAKEQEKFREILRRIEENIQAKMKITKNTRSCPNCKIPVEKIGGCNKMTCKCSAVFCWLCGKSIEGYSHFRSTTCALFPENAPPVMVGVARRPPDIVLRMQARMELNPDLHLNQIRCPSCKQMSLKGQDKNNHIKCWNCKTNFCFMCRQKITGIVNLHFTGPCRQHS